MRSIRQVQVIGLPKPTFGRGGRGCVIPAFPKLAPGLRGLDEVPCAFDYGCTLAPEDIAEPENCRYTYNPETNRLYLHLLVWPFKFIHLAGKVEYVQLLTDGSEIFLK